MKAGYAARPRQHRRARSQRARLDGRHRNRLHHRNHGDRAFNVGIGNWLADLSLGRVSLVEEPIELSAKPGMMTERFDMTVPRVLPLDPEVQGD